MSTSFLHRVDSFTWESKFPRLECPSPSISFIQDSPSYNTEDNSNSLPSPHALNITKPLVGHCKNCSFSFRRSTRNLGEFCSKDCETCYTLFYKSAPSTPMKSAEEVKLDIFEFQRQLDELEEKNNHDKLSNAENITHQDEEMQESKDTFEVLESDKKTKKKKNPFSQKVKKEKTKEGEKDFLQSLFAYQLPLRPAIHAYLS